MPESTLAAGIDPSNLFGVEARIEVGAPVQAQWSHDFDGGPTMGDMRPRAVLQVDNLIPTLMLFVCRV